MSGARVVRGTCPLAGVQVVELADNPAGEQTGKLLADLGADVVKVEPPDGASSRRTGPFRTGSDGQASTESLAFLTYNSSKRSVVLDDTDEGRRRLGELIAEADVLISTDTAGQLEGRALRPEDVVTRHPRLVFLSITPFGLTGPWAEYRTSELVALAAGGPLYSCGYDDHSIPPILPGGGQAYHLAASFALSSVMLALIDRQHGGRGQVVDVSIHESCAVSCELANPYWFYPRVLVRRQTCRHAQPEPTAPALFRCGDGVYVYFALILADQRAWDSLVAWMTERGVAADLDDPAYRDLKHRQRQFGRIQDLLEVFFLLQESDGAYLEGQRRGLPIAPLRALEDLASDEHLRARRFFVDLTLADGTQVTYPGAPFRFSEFEMEPTRPPLLGEHDPVAGSFSDGAS